MEKLSISTSEEVDVSVKETMDAKFSEDDAGTCINQYLLQKSLGVGSFGCVWLGYNTINNTYVAVKEFSKSRMRKHLLIKTGLMFGGSRGRGRFAPSKEPQISPIELIKGELAILKKLKHKNIVRLFEGINSLTF
jgi:serine/threonine protein kinase